jgi:putative ABC transport system substrate-binding protein
MRRREVLSLLGGAAVAWPLAARAQQAKVLTIGFMGSGTLASQGKWVAAFVQRLRERGWVEGRNLAIDYRWAEGRSERMAEIAAEFSRLKVDVILTYSTQAALAAKQATASIPVVFTLVADPVGSGLVAGLARPGGNVTGISTQSTDLAGKRLELLREAVPGLATVAILANVANPSAQVDVSELQAAARTVGIAVEIVEIRKAADIAPALESLAGRAQAIYFPPDPLFFVNRIRISKATVGARLPTIYATRDFVEAGGLMSYGPNFTDLFSRAGNHVDKILRGAKPADLPVEQPTRFDLVVNLITARALGITVPPTLLARADEVIE